MVFEEKQRIKPELPGDLTLRGRSNLCVSGVRDVVSFDEGSVELDTTAGTLFIRGRELRVEKLSIDGGDLVVAGTVDSLTYGEEKKPRGKLFGRLFG